MDYMTCTQCGKKVKRVYDIAIGIELCSRCYHTDYCVFCTKGNEPFSYILKKDCKGHKATESTGNRFMDDRDFAYGARMDLE